jgi:predicted ATPase/DNA-binding CsgD family transcriptional regulator
MATLALPFIAPNLIDRDKELAHIIAALTGDIPLLTIVGPGGAGKTHLSVRAAQQLQTQFERIVFVDLSVAKVETVLPMVLQQLELPGSDNILGQLAYVLSQHKTLLILDNFETVLEAASHINDLLARCPNLCILVTSRSRLGLRAESCLPLPPLETDPKDAPAVDFFVKRVQTLQPHFRLEGHETDIYKLCQRLDGLPLALELAAACIPAMTPGALLGHLGSHTSLPEVTVRDLPLRQQNLYQLVVSSVSLLGVREQNFFCRLGVFVGSFSLEAARAVTDAEALGIDAVATLIKLCEHSLVVAEPVTPPRYRLLETIRAVALEMLSDPDPFADVQSETPLLQAQRRHLEYYLEFANKNYDSSKGYSKQFSPASLEPEYPNICAAVRWAAQQGEPFDEPGLRLFLNTAWFWNVKGYTSEAHQFLGSFSGQYQPSVQAHWLQLRAAFCISVGYIKESLQLGQEALELSRHLGDTKKCAEILNQLGISYARHSDYVKALEYFDESAHVAEQIGDIANVCSTINNRGVIYNQMGEYLKARACFEKALAFAKETLDEHTQLLYKGNVATTWVHEDKVCALALLEETVKLAKQLGSQNVLATSLKSISGLHFQAGNLCEAQATAEESLNVRKLYGDMYGVAATLGKLGVYAQYQQHNETAATHFQESQMLFQKLGALVNAAHVKSLFARQFHDDPSKAVPIHLETVRVILTTSLIEAEYMTDCLDALLDLEVKAGRWQEATVLWGAIQKLSVYDKDVMWSRAGLNQLEETLDKETFEGAVERGKMVDLNELYKELCQRWMPDKTSEQNTLVQMQTDALSVRQLEVLKLVAQGYSSKKIAKTFDLSEATVKYHLNSIYNKLGVNSRAEAVAQATQRHLL